MCIRDSYYVLDLTGYRLPSLIWGIAWLGMKKIWKKELVWLVGKFGRRMSLYLLSYNIYALCKLSHQKRENSFEDSKHRLDRGEFPAILITASGPWHITPCPVIRDSLICWYNIAIATGCFKFFHRIYLVLYRRGSAFWTSHNTHFIHSPLKSFFFVCHVCNTLLKIWTIP